MDFILNELMHTKSSDERGQKFFHEALIDSIMNENYAVEVIEAFTELIKNLPYTDCMFWATSTTGHVPPA